MLCKLSARKVVDNTACMLLERYRRPRSQAIAVTQHAPAARGLIGAESEGVPAIVACKRAVKVRWCLHACATHAYFSGLWLTDTMEHPCEETLTLCRHQRWQCACECPAKGKNQLHLLPFANAGLDLCPFRPCRFNCSKQDVPGAHRLRPAELAAARTFTEPRDAAGRRLTTAACRAVPARLEVKHAAIAAV